MDGGVWWATVHGVAKSRAQLSDFVSFKVIYRQSLQKSILASYMLIKKKREEEWTYGIFQL